MTVTIGSTDITKYIQFGGISFSRNDVDAPSAGRDMEGLMHRARVAVKEKIEITTRPMTRSEATTIYSLLEPDTISVTVNPHPNTNASKTMTMYSNNVKTSYVIHRANGEDIVTVSFPLVEV